MPIAPASGPLTHPNGSRYPSAGERTSAPFLQTPANESLAVFSPDSRWVAYVSDESGRSEV